MRFMGFSSKVGKIPVFALALALVTSLGVVSFPAEAQADKKLVWSVKFVCHHDRDPADGISDLGLFGNTVINIHNPTEDPVELNKKVVIAFRESGSDFLKFLEGEENIDAGAAAELAGINVGTPVGDTLGPNDSFFVDCFELKHILFDFNDMISTFRGLGVSGDELRFLFPSFSSDDPADPVVYFDGFLVIEVRKTRRNNAKTKHPLVVTSHHFLIGSIGFAGISGVSRHIEQIRPVKVKGKFELADPLDFDFFDLCDVISSIGCI